jgi:hypothetical protein
MSAVDDEHLSDSIVNTGFLLTKHSGQHSFAINVVIRIAFPGEIIEQTTDQTRKAVKNKYFLLKNKYLNDQR